MLKGALVTSDQTASGGVVWFPRSPGPCSSPGLLSGGGVRRRRDLEERKHGFGSAGQTRDPIQQK